MSSQIKLLRLLESGEYLPFGRDVKKKSSARFVVATNKDLLAEVEASNFREDLYFRLRTHHVHIPPLRERREDIPLLLDHFVTEAASEYRIPVPSIPSALTRLLERHDFPGNIRELRGMMLDAISRSGLLRSKEAGSIHIEPLLSAVGSTVGEPPRPESRRPSYSPRDYRR